MKKENVRKALSGFAVLAVVAALWMAATTFGNIPSGILPGIPDIWTAFTANMKSGQLESDLFVSLTRVVKGFAVAAVLGIGVGTIVGMSRTAREMLLPAITVIRQIPIIAWIPLIILWAGIGEGSKVIIIAIAAFFPIMVNTESGIEQTPQGLIEVAKLYKLGEWKTFRRVCLPHALPQMLVGLRLGLGVSWMAVVAAELIAATSGIGYRLSDARSLMRADVVIVCMIVIGLVGVAMDKMIGLVFQWMMPWERVRAKG